MEKEKRRGYQGKERGFIEWKKRKGGVIKAKRGGL